MILELHRLIENPKELQLGVLKIDGFPSFTTAELPWRDNRPKASCIPTGEYKLSRFNSPKFKTEVWRINHVNNRDDILIHWGNFAAETEGCILIGMSFGVLRGVHTIINSKVAFHNFMQATEAEKELTLYVWEE